MRRATLRMFALSTLLLVGLSLSACAEETPSGDDEFQLDGTAQTDGGADGTDEGEDSGDDDQNGEDTGTPDTEPPPEDVAPLPDDTSDPAPEDTNTGTDQDGGSEPVGACCAEGGCGTTTESDCEDAGGTWNQGKTCAEVDCVDESVCCAQFRGSTACVITDPSRCMGEFNGTVKPDATSCRDVTCDGKSDLWACCGMGLCGNTTKSTCDQFGADYNDGKTCSEIDC